MAIQDSDRKWQALLYVKILLNWSTYLVTEPQHNKWVSWDSQKVINFGYVYGQISIDHMSEGEDVLCMLLTRIGKKVDGKPFSSQEKVGILLILEKSGDFTQNTEKLKKDSGNVWEICQPVTMKTLQIWYHTLN